MEIGNKRLSAGIRFIVQITSVQLFIFYLKPLNYICLRQTNILLTQRCFSSSVIYREMYDSDMYENITPC